MPGKNHLKLKYTQRVLGNGGCWRGSGRMQNRNTENKWDTILGIED